MKWLGRFKLSYGFDWGLYLVPLILTIFGTAVIFSITYGTSTNLAYDQISYIAIGFIIAIALSTIDYRILKGLYLILYISGILLLVVVLLLGTKSFGASRWINLGIFQLQPSELFKFISLIVLAKFFSDWQEITIKKILIVVGFVVPPLVLIMLQPDLGTASVVFVSFIAIFLISPIKKVYLAIALAVMMALSPLGWQFLRPYQKSRIEAFINPASDPHGAGYNVNQAKIAVGSGGLFGQGLGRGTQSQLNFLPVAHTDFIFAGTAEATGFVGSTFLILLLIYLVFRVIVVAKNARDGFGMYLAGGIGAVFLFQILVNIGMNMGIMPVTGIPLPFVSYGGSSMLSNFAAIGILQSIYLRRKITF